MINIAKLLKNCPTGTRLYSPLFGEVKLDDASGMICVTTKYGSSKCFTETGCYYVDNETFSTECLLFPSKECRTWEGWEAPVEPNFKVGDWIAGIDDEGDVSTEKVVSFSHNKVLLLDTDGCQTEYPKTELNGFHLWSISDAKDGDVLATDNGWTCIFKRFNGYTFGSYCFKDSQKWFCEVCSEAHTLDSRINGNIHPATKEQRDLFFKKIREAGYEWDEQKKELHKIQPHYDIANFHAGMPVLVRDKDNCKWCYVLYSHYDNTYEDGLCFNAGSLGWRQCIPFNEETKHLLGATDMPSEEFINW
jgi:hypothetical protein